MKKKLALKQKNFVLFFLFIIALSYNLKMYEKSNREMQKNQFKYKNFHK